MHDLIGRNDESVLVDIIQLMQCKQIPVPSRIRARHCKYFDDLWSGQIYMSLRDGLHKSARVFGKWILDPIWAGRIMRGNKFPNGMIKGTPQVVDCIAGDQPETIWDGFVACDADGALAALFIVMDDNFPVLSEETRGLRLKVVDVMLGSFNL